ncbi:SCP-like extracellular protein [Bacillus tamaricis]|uniref:SCP-like extracellular protein n=2 Tax=Evansella tamaricis TaxID=2069301 RepID=A0ABS6JM43_9BACI|nr:CAP domain-containing protein [Evansella tamaricis]MBU9714741.1 SCP-like extracellular protein [Evansella tamaricis]
MDNDDDSISSDSTAIPSEQYPETKAVKIQEAKYKFVVDGQQNSNWKQHLKNKWGGGTKEQQGTSPEQGSQQEQAPTEQEAPPQEEQQVETTPQQETDQQTSPQGEAGISDYERKVIELTNVERRNNGLPDFEADAQLSSVARAKSKDMQENNYFSHTSPTYGSPFDMMRDFGVSYKTAGENIAQGQQTPEQVVQSWMNSEGHRKNILSSDFTHLGVGYDQNGHHWTQMFISK